MVVYLLGLMILMVGIWNILPFGLLSPDVFLVLSFAYLLLSFILFPNKKMPALFGKKMLPFWLIIAGMAISAIPAKIFHEQSPLQSLITCRAQFLWIAIPILMRLAPDKRQLFISTLIFTGMMLVVTILHSMVPSMFPVAYNVEDKIIDEYTVPGFTVAAIPFAIALEQFHKTYDPRYIVAVLFCFLFCFVTRNRTSIMCFVLVTGFSFLFSKSRFKYVFMVFLTLLGVMFFIRTLDVWLELMDETVLQLGDEDYNRNKALVYFFSPMANPSWVTYLLGNGYLSSNVTSLMQDLMKEGIYNSDMGYIGYWNQFGLIPIVAFYMVIFHGLWGEGASLLTKELSVYIFFASFTIGYYAETHHLLFYIMAYVLMYKNSKKRYCLVRIPADDNKSGQ